MELGDFRFLFWGWVLEDDGWWGEFDFCLVEVGVLGWVCNFDDIDICGVRGILWLLFDLFCILSWRGILWMI